jgi:hypothetical protein
MPVYTNATLLATIKRKAAIPAIQETFSDQDLLDVATDEIYNTILPAIMNTREEFYVVKQEVPLTAPGKSTHQIPSRAIGMGLRELSITTSSIERNMPRYDIEDKIYDNKSGINYGFYLQGNNVHILGQQTGTLNMYFFLRPGHLVTVGEATTITSLDPDNKQMTLNNIPTGWTVGTIVDTINNKPGFDVKQMSNTITAISGTLVTFQDAFTTYEDGSQRSTVGNWISEEETSPVPQMPIEFWQYLAEAVTAYVMESQGDGEAFERSQKRMASMLKNCQKMIAPRVDGEGKKFVSRSMRGSGSFNHWRW